MQCNTLSAISQDVLQALPDLQAKPVLQFTNTRKLIVMTLPQSIKSYKRLILP